MKKYFKKIVTCLAVLVFTVFVAMPVNAANELQTLNKTVTEEKLALGGKQIAWIDNKDNSTTYFYGKEYGTNNFYKIGWDGNVTAVADPYSGATSQPAYPTLPVAGGNTYTTTVGDDGVSMDITSSTGKKWNVSMSKLVASINGSSTAGSPLTPGTVITGVNVLGELNNQVYYAIEQDSKYYLANGSGELFYSKAIEKNQAVIGYVSAGHGIVLVKNASGAKVIDFNGREIAEGTDISVSKFGFIGVEYNDTASNGTTQKHTKILSYEGTTLLTGRTGELAHYVASTVKEDNTASDYLRNGSHVFTIVDPYTSTTCHYKLTISGSETPIPTPSDKPNPSPTPDPENPSTATGGNEMTMTLVVATISVGAIYVASRKLKRDF